MKKLYSRLLSPFAVLAALLLIFEEWLWEKLAALLGSVSRIIGFDRIEARIVRLPPYAALALFLLPSLILLPAKLAGLALLAKGQVLLSLFMLGGAKLAGTAVLARIFKLTKPQLLQLTWFARLYGVLVGWLVRAHTWFDGLAVVAATRTWVKRAKASLAQRRRSLFMRLTAAARARMARINSKK